MARLGSNQRPPACEACSPGCLVLLGPPRIGLTMRPGGRLRRRRRHGCTRRIRDVWARIRPGPPSGGSAPTRIWSSRLRSPLRSVNRVPGRHRLASDSVELALWAALKGSWLGVGCGAVRVSEHVLPCMACVNRAGADVRECRERRQKADAAFPRYGDLAVRASRRTR